MNDAGSNIEKMWSLTDVLDELVDLLEKISDDVSVNNELLKEIRDQNKGEK